MVYHKTFIFMLSCIHIRSKSDKKKRMMRREMNTKSGLCSSNSPKEAVISAPFFAKVGAHYKVRVRG